MASWPSDDPYEALGVSEDATLDEIKRAYRALAREHHPDRNPGDPQAEERFKRIAAAFEQLSSAGRRQDVDRRRRHRSRGTLPEPFVQTVRDAIDRAQTYIERAVLPHVAARWRGAGAVAVGELWRDLDDLRNPYHLSGEQPDFVARWRARALARDVAVALDESPASMVSMRHRTLSGIWVITVLPWVLHQQRFTDPIDIDDAILRVLLQQYAVILASGRFTPPADPEDWGPALARARQRDDAHQVSARLRWLGYALLATVVLVLLFSGYQRW